MKTFGAAAQAVAKSHHCYSVDLWTSMQQESPETWGDYLNDGLHLSEAGNEFVYLKLSETLAGIDSLKLEPCKYSGSFGNSGSSSALQQLFPWHDKIDPQATPSF